MAEAKEIVVNQKEREEVIIPTLEGEIEKLVEDYNTLIATEGFSFEEAKILRDTIDAKVKKLEENRENLCYWECSNAENPMAEACERYFYDTLAVKETDSKEFVKPLEVKNVSRKINLLRLDKYMEGSLGSSKEWKHWVEMLNAMLCYRESLRLKNEKAVSWEGIISNFAMSSAAHRCIDVDGNPAVSNRDVNGYLQRVVAAMLGYEYKCNLHDVRMIEDTYIRTTKNPLVMKAPSSSNLIKGQIMTICHRIVTDGEYDVEFKVQKKKDKKGKKEKKAVKVEEKPIEETPAVVTEEIAA